MIISTLIRLLLRFYDVTSGQILINGIDIKEYSLTDLRTKPDQGACPPCTRIQVPAQAAELPSVHGRHTHAGAAHAGGPLLLRPLSQVRHIARA